MVQPCLKAQAKTASKFDRQNYCTQGRSSMHRREFLGLMVGVSLIAVGSTAFAELPKLEKKDKYKVGFAQTESNNLWRIAETGSKG
jgi:hypothetical protein